jgi:hypothetical protein
MTVSAIAVAGPAPWCGGDIGSATYSITNNGSFKYDSDADDLADVDGFADIVLAMCSRDPDATRFHSQLEAARARWGKRLHMAESDWVDALPFATEMLGFRRSFKLDVAGQGFALAELGPVAQYSAFRRADILTAIEAADAAGAHLSMSARTGLAAACLEGADVDPVPAALCVGDMKIDLDTLNAELRVDRADDPAAKMSLRLVAEEVVRKLWPARKAKLAALITSDDAYRQLFDVAKAARTEWDRRKDELAPLREEAWVMFNALQTHSRKAAAGCEAATWPVLQQRISAIPAGDFAAAYRDFTSAPLDPIVRRIMSEPAGYLAARNYASCMRTTDRGSRLVTAISDAAEQPGFSGPRGAALATIMRANPQTDRGGSLKFPRPGGGNTYRMGGSNKQGAGVLKSANTEGQAVHLAFASSMRKVTQCAGYVETKKIVAITPDGQLLYEQRCTGSETIKVNDASEPQDVDVRFGSMLKPGMSVVVDGDAVVIAWAKAGSKLPSFVLGQPVK